MSAMPSEARTEEGFRYRGAQVTGGSESTDVRLRTELGSTVRSVPVLNFLNHLSSPPNTIIMITSWFK